MFINWNLSFFFQLQDSNSEPDVDLENQYYNSKALKEDDPKAALESFQVHFMPRYQIQENTTYLQLLTLNLVLCICLRIRTMKLRQLRQPPLNFSQRVLDLENQGEKCEWGFKALKQMIKINFRLQNYEAMMSRYKLLLTYIKSAVTRNHSEKSINSILDYISTSKQMQLLQDFYEVHSF